MRAPPDPSSFPEITVAHSGGADMRLHVASIASGSMETPGGGAVRHLSLPSDLFVLSIFGDDGLDCRQDGEVGHIGIAVSAMRTQAARFETRGGGVLATATLTPIGLLSAFRAPLAGLTNMRIPLDHFCSGGEKRSLRDAVMNAKGDAERARSIGRWLETRIMDSRGLATTAARRAGNSAMALMRGATDKAGLDEVARAHAATRRQLERDFRHWFGVSPGNYTRVVRFQRAAANLADGMALADTAANHGFADQAHMNRAFRDTCGMTPRELARISATPKRRILRGPFAGRVMMADLAAA